VHKAKGLEWPIVIPINLVSMPRPIEEFFFNAEHNTVHWTFGEIASSTLAAAVADDKVQTAEERERLLYVACTRALDLLILPSPSWWRDDSWFSFFDLGQERIAEIRAMTPIAKAEQSAGTPNSQTKAVFDAEAARIDAGTHTIIWQRPSLDDPDRELLERATVDAARHENDPQSQAIVIGAGPLRGVVLHKLMEELLTALLVPDVTKLTSRAALLIDQIAIAGDVRPDPQELATTALATFQHNELRGYIDKLVPEFPLYGARSEDLLVSARADAVATENGKPIAVFDWKSDVSPSAADRQAYDGQLLQYLELIWAPKGAVVYMTTREVRWVHLPQE
jgi:CRISPR-associated exonuclease Cas4